MNKQLIEYTHRGFGLYNFKDLYDSECSIQKSSLATQDTIWLGINDANPKILHGDATKLGIKHNKDSGWVDYHVPEEVLMNTRVHLTREQAKVLGEMLILFAATGELPSNIDILNKGG